MTRPPRVRARADVGLGGGRPRALRARELLAEVKREARHLPILPSEAELLTGLRPRTRGECANGPRPCPWVGCRFHLYLDVEDGHLRYTFPDREPDELAETCALDVADRAEGRFREVAHLSNLTEEGLRLFLRPLEQRLRLQGVIEDIGEAFGVGLAEREDLRIPDSAPDRQGLPRNRSEERKFSAEYLAGAEISDGEAGLIPSRPEHSAPSHGRRKR